MYIRSIVLGLSLFALSSASLGQEAESQGRQAAAKQDSKYPSFESSELKLVQFRPQHVNMQSLYRVVDQMLGRNLHVVERGMPGRPLRNLSQLGSQVIIYDTPEYSQRVLEVLGALDITEDSTEESVEESPYTEVLVGYTARHVPTEYLLSGLRSFGNIQYSAAGDRMISARVERYRAEELAAFIRSMDQPLPSVIVSCYLLQGSGEDSQATGPQPPADVLASLNRILPDADYRSIGFSMVQSSVSEGRAIELSVNGADLRRYQLRFNPQAYDSESGDMTVKDCEVQFQAAMSPLSTSESRSKNPSTVLLRTDTVFRGDQYTVLGASGQDPVYIVIHNKKMP